ncbi:uncharacterized protein LOC143294884 isoform X2 [Babylonia areolata]|uniref:uncharacterized protein LOC143294884 isoform X2 n=1 Tax=Babylonia areolata TaxID=304850 RepID=UPI003FD0D8FD
MISFVGLVALGLYFVMVYRSHKFTETRYVWGRTPATLAILLKILVRIIRRRQGEIYRVDGEKERWTDENDAQIAPSRDEVVIISGYRVTSDMVAHYKTVCGGTKKDMEGDGAIPLCFPDCLFVHNLLLLVCKPSFKLSPLGLIHIGQTIERHSNLEQLLCGPCLLEVRTTAYRRVSKGVEVDISVCVVPAATGLPVWSGVATLLSRSRQVQQSRGGTASSTMQQSTGDCDWDQRDNVSSQQIEAAGNTGVKYAGVSGDWNPHHLYRWTAWLLGYRAPIAHGLWTLAKAVALVSDTADSDDLSHFTKVECRFKRPLFLPGTAILQHYTDGSAIKFQVIDSKTQVPHLVGTLT